MSYRCSLVPWCSVASFPGSPFPFLTFFACEYYTQKIEGEGEPGTEPRPPVATLASHDYDHGGHALHCAQCRSRAALWIMTTSPKDPYTVDQLNFFTEAQGHRSKWQPWQKISTKRYKLKAFTTYYLCDFLAMLLRSNYYYYYYY